ncbi:anti-sigma factor [Epibacterium sp. Ofav1-8]|uniref:anti-sigma factor n=1 Tax=Epibacterium sp. Ofav1-8 TaxID=2917735 RepID=UPI001EF5405C|nr:anti-sigma factor [Epibacterium sp. Ofav1-8]MCG7626089.1 anti-sigma factor [Epibacterium sp. Ofav1-8]
MGRTMELPAANSDRPPHGWRLSVIAAACAVLCFGLAGSFHYGAHTARLAASAWVMQVVGSHDVYETQSRHLVEVAASEKDHIESWLGKTTGVTFATPDLTAHGLEFRGARLLAANGLPVAQLLNTDRAGSVVALCIAPVDTSPTDAAANIRKVGSYDTVSWSASGARFVFVGPESTVPLSEVLATTKQQLLAIDT